ncbi:hypothetical protein EFY79_10900 [Hanamia caeni]|uniref:Uncharacterized protein n=1 Tax=Hanamia caeni TaxID=2294116 RepID=A0A3M9NFW3_9BACT|nr:hypothetical protein EFY79_10900 [Hanamia caeni]
MLNADKKNQILKNKDFKVIQKLATCQYIICKVNHLKHWLVQAFFVIRSVNELLNGIFIFH